MIEQSRTNKAFNYNSFARKSLEKVTLEEDRRREKICDPYLVIVHRAFFIVNRVVSMGKTFWQRHPHCCRSELSYCFVLVFTLTGTSYLKEHLKGFVKNDQISPLFAVIRMPRYD